MRRSAEPLAERMRSRLEIGRLVRDQEVGGSNPLAPTIFFNNLQVVIGRNAHPFAHPLRKLLL